MTIYIHRSDGSVSEHAGITPRPGPLSALCRLGFEVYPNGRIPQGDYGTGELYAVRAGDKLDEYGADEYDVAEICM
jgi:hypothetical protein